MIISMVYLLSIIASILLYRDQKIVLAVNDSVSEYDIFCFTDSVTYQPFKVKKTYDNDKKYYVIKPFSDGYYWCVHVDSKNFYVTESNKALFIRTKQLQANSYAIRIRQKTEYKLDERDPLSKDWVETTTKKLEEYIFYRTKYFQIYGDLEPADLKGFKSSHPGLKPKHDELSNMELKRLYLDGKSALIHIRLNSDMLPVPPGVWEDLEVVFMKPAYYCKGFDAVPTLSLGKSFFHM